MVNPLEKIPGLAKLPKGGKVAVLGAATVAVGYVAYRYVKGKQTPAEPVASSTDLVDDYSAIPDTTSPISPTQGGSGGDGEFEEGPGPTTDDAWVRDAVTKLYAAGYQDTAMTSRVLSLWLQGQPLEDGEVVIARTAVGLAGRPPSGDHPFIPKQSAPSNPTPSQPTQPAAPVTSSASTWVVRKGQTLQYIANYLNNRTPHWAGHWQDIYYTNRSLIGSNPNKLTVGITLQIPNPPPY